MAIFRRRKQGDIPEQEDHELEALGVDAQDLDEMIRTALVPGFNTRDDVVDAALDYLDHQDAVRTIVERRVDRAWNARRAEESTWTSDGDYDRLARAFAALRADNGILGCMNFGVDVADATDSIDAERTPAPLVDGHYRWDAWYRWNEWAYVYFHQQDADRLADLPATLYLGYSAFRADPSLDAGWLANATEAQIHRMTDAAVGRAVVAALRAQGLDPHWDGIPTHRIEIVITSWRKPLPVR